MQNTEIEFRKLEETSDCPGSFSPKNIALPHQPSSDKSTLSIICFDNEIPPFVEPALNRLYGSLYSSMPYFRVYGGLDRTSTFVAKRGDDFAAIFLFRCEHRQAHVLNEGMAIEPSVVNTFADYIFDRFKAIEIISFHAVESTINKLRFPYHQFNCTSDSVVRLPGSAEAYFDSLGKSTRKNIRQYLKRVQRDYPSFTFQVDDAREANEQHVRSLIEFNRMRFAIKQKVSAITSEEEDRIVRMVRECGMVGIATIDGQPVAGSITYCFGDHYHSRLRTCNPAFDEYRLGLICGYLMMNECIRRRGDSFHFMAGGEPQKALLQGQHRDQMHVTVCRSSMTALRHIDILFKQSCQDMLHRMKLGLLTRAKADGQIPMQLRSLVSSVRRIKKLLTRQA